MPLFHVIVKRTWALVPDTSKRLIFIVPRMFAPLVYPYTAQLVLERFLVG